MGSCLDHMVFVGERIIFSPITHGRKYFLKILSLFTHTLAFHNAPVYYRQMLTLRFYFPALGARQQLLGNLS